jgi:hypothetical protein
MSGPQRREQPRNDRRKRGSKYLVHDVTPSLIGFPDPKNIILKF